DAAVMDHCTRARQQRLIRHVVERDDSFGKRARQVALVTDEQHGATPQTLRCSNAFLIKITRDPHRRRTQREDDRWRAIIQEVLELDWNLDVVIAVVKTEARDLGLRRPVWLSLAKQF